jgi:carboxymethylenebutenolidase
MSEQDLRIQTRDGSMATFVAHPDEGGPFPVVIAYMDALGLREELKMIGRRIAGEGYYAIVPDLYYRFGDGITFDASKLRDPESDEMQRMFGTMQNLTDPMVVSDTEAILEHAAGDPVASDGPKGCVGFCLGGRLVVRAMANFPDEFAAGAAFHPSFIVKPDDPDSPHLEIGKIRGEFYAGLGGADQFQPAHLFESAQAEFDKHGLRCTSEIHDDADHGYMIPGAPIFHESASERSWEQTFEMFRRTLQAAPVGAA